MAEPKKALATPPMLNQVQINLVSGSWSPVPVNSSVQPTGTVQFIPNQTGWVWTMVGTTLTDVFQGQTGNYVQVVPGQQNKWNPTVSDGTTVTIIPQNPNAAPPSQTPDNVRGTIKVSSTGLEGEHEK
jgi:hypothetical protein